MKYDSMRKIERNKALREYAENHPRFSLQEIGEIFGISKQRVSIILKGGNDVICGQGNSQSSSGRTSD